MKRKGGKLHVIFIDFKTASDSVNWKRLFIKLEKKGIKGKMLKMIKGLYTNILNEIITEEGLTEKFATSRGLKEG